MYNFISWNINGYKDITHLWVKKLIQEHQPDILFLSETKKNETILSKYLDEFIDYEYILNVHNPPHHHGVAMLIKKPHQYIEYHIDLNIPARADTKDGNPTTGRIIALELNQKYIIIGSYIPNSGTNFHYRVNIWDPAMSKLLNLCQHYKPVIWLGDINVAPSDLDICPYLQHKNIPGCSKEEQTNFTKFITPNWVDAWRSQHPHQKSYSWVGANRKPNYGLRLDNIIVSNNISFTSTSIMPDYYSSDHVPVNIIIAS